MNRTGRTLALGCLLLLHPLLANAGGNSLLIPAVGR
ncbi:MAG: Sel1 repeat-containing protein, partial [Pseudomonas sp.]|nr:Sel1 repeat-containing protein [Pseudomonas sp.]